MRDLTVRSKLETGPGSAGDWVSIESSLTDAVETCTTESSLQFDGGWVEVRRYRLLRPAESVWATSRSSYFFDLSLAPRPPARGTLLGLGSHEAPDILSRIMIVPPGQKVRSGSRAGHFRSMRCVLDADLIDGILQGRARWSEPSLRQAFSLSGGEIEWLLRRMYQEVRRGGFASNVAAAALARTLSVELIRRFRLNCAETGQGRRPDAGGLAPWRMRLLRERVQADGPVPGLAELADLCCLTERHLNRAFKRETGQTLGKFVKAAMVERARFLLTDTNMPVKEIARKLGFATSGSFAHAFRGGTGFLPSEVRGHQESGTGPSRRRALGASGSGAM